jgi:2-phospho-L-lactate guanylyltransferase
MALHEIVAIIPIRLLPSTKHRLEQKLDGTQRQQLVKSMLNDVFKAIGQSTMISRLVIITSDMNYLSSYPSIAFELYESSARGLNEELHEYLDVLSEKGKGYAIVILGDLPLLTGSVLDNLIFSGLRSKRPVIARDWKGLGTNVLFFTYPIAFNFYFGENSFSKHLLEMHSKGCDPIIYHSMETALDIDDDSAIGLLLTLAEADDRIQETETYRLIWRNEKGGVR